MSFCHTVIAGVSPAAFVSSAGILSIPSPSGSFQVKIRITDDTMFFGKNNHDAAFSMPGISGDFSGDVSAHCLPSPLTRPLRISKTIL